MIGRCICHSDKKMRFNTILESNNRLDSAVLFSLKYGVMFACWSIMHVEIYT